MHRYSSDFKKFKKMCLGLVFVIYWIYDSHEDKNNSSIEKHILNKMIEVH